MSKINLIKHIKDHWLKYIFEVIVVVLGVLIAITLDNWNEQRKINSIEVNALKEINTGLKRLAREVEINLEDEINAQNSCNFIIHNFENDLGLSDSLKMAFSLAWVYSHLQPDYGAYEYVNNYGASVITNSAIRESILKLYGLDLRATVSESKIRGEYIESLKLKMWQWYQSMNSNTYNYGPTEPLNYQDLRKDLEFLYHLKTQLNECNRWTFELENLHKYILNVVNQIDSEIEKLEY